MNTKGQRDLLASARERTDLDNSRVLQSLPLVGSTEGPNGTVRPGSGSWRDMLSQRAPNARINVPHSGHNLLGWVAIHVGFPQLAPRQWVPINRLTPVEMSRVDLDYFTSAGTAPARHTTLIALAEQRQLGRRHRAAQAIADRFSDSRERVLRNRGYAQRPNWLERVALRLADPGLRWRHPVKYSRIAVNSVTNAHDVLLSTFDPNRPYVISPQVPPKRSRRRGTSGRSRRGWRH